MSSTKQIETEAKKGIPQRKKRGLCQQDRPVVEPNAAGIDVGAREMYVAIPPDRDSEPVRIFKTFTADLECLVDWLKARGITTVAMESTGVYWIPLYQMLEDRGVRACLVNARHMKNVPPSKSQSVRQGIAHAAWELHDTSKVPGWLEKCWIEGCF